MTIKKRGIELLQDASLNEATLARGVSQALFDKKVVPINMTRRGSADLS